MMRDSLPIIIPVALLAVVLVVVVWLLERGDKEKRAECRKAGGVVLPDSWGWNCHMPTPDARLKGGES